jgi:hypothetical protein
LCESRTLHNGNVVPECEGAVYNWSASARSGNLETGFPEDQDFKQKPDWDANQTIIHPA